MMKNLVSWRDMKSDMKNKQMFSLSLSGKCGGDLNPINSTAFAW
jgi:hypothetical protein